MAVPKEIKDLIKNSGNSFHAKVAREMAAKAWRVRVSPYYLDQTLGKAREIDLVAERVWTIGDRTHNPHGGIAVRLFMECKYVPRESVFWFADKDRDAATKLVCERTPFRDDNFLRDKHHYLADSPRVAKVFASNAKGDAEREPFYKALNQVLNAMVSLQTHTVAAPELKNAPRGIRYTFDFPVVVCSAFDKLYRTDFDSSSNPDRIKENFQLEVQYAYVDGGGRHKDKYFLLDIVEFAQLGKFLSAIDQDVTAATDLAYGT